MLLLIIYKSTVFRFVKGGPRLSESAGGVDQREDDDGET
jgi:hypothetical protein